MSGKQTLKSILRWLPGILISLVAVYFLSRFINFDDLLKAVKKLTVLDIAFIILLNILSSIARSLGWKNLLDGVTFKQAFLIVNEGYLFNNLIPRSGEIVRTLLVSSISKISPFQVASSVLVERALDVVIAATMFLLTLPLAVEMEWVKPIAWVLFICFFSMIITLVFLARNSKSVKKHMTESKIKSVWMKETVFPKLASILDGLAALNQPAKFARSVFWILVSWLCWTSLIYFGITRIFGAVPVWWAIFAQGMLALGIALPSAPAGLGVYEGTLVAALAVFGIDKSSSLSVALVLHFTQILLTAVFGIFGLIVQGQSMSELVSRLWNQKPETADHSIGDS